MKNFWKYLGYTTLGVATLVYLGFLFVLPNAVKIDEYKPLIQDLAKEQAKLGIDFENAKIITTPLLGVGIKTDNIKITLPDESVLFSADSLKTRIALPSLFLMTVKVSCLEVEKPFVNIEILENGDMKIVNFVEGLLNAGKEQKLEARPANEVEKKGFQFNPAWIKIKVPCVKVNNYKVLVNDLSSKHYLDLRGKELKLGYFNGKKLKIKTYAELFSDENKNITANVDINTFLPKPQPQLDKEDDPAERIDINIINPVEMYRNYDLKANLDTKLRIRDINGEINSYGHLNVENITLKISHLQLPESYLRAKTFGTTVDLDTNIYPYTSKEENIQLLGKLNYGQHPKLNMAIKTGIIKFNDMLNLGKAVLDSLSIKHELNNFTAEGTLKADCFVKTNFKKLKSFGSLIVKNGGLNVKGVGKVLSSGNINIFLDNNILDIKDSSILIGGAPLNIDGKIDKKSVADISIKAEKLPLPKLFNAFAPQNLKKVYNFKSGDASLDLSIRGKLKSAVAGIIFGLDKLNISDKTMNISNEKLVGEFFADRKDLRGNISNDNFVLALPATGSRILAPKMGVIVEDNNITISENSVLLNDNTNIKYSGNVIDYTKLKSIDFNAHGLVNTDDLVKIIGKEYKPFIHSHGVIPVKLTIDGDRHKQTLFAQALSNKDNFITPIDFENVQGDNTSLQAVMDFKANRIKIKKTGFFKRIITVDEKGNEIVNLDEVFGIDGTIEGNRINLIKLTIPNDLRGKLHVFPQSDFTLNGRGFVFGETSAPRLRGGFTVSNFSIPELLLTLKEGGLKFRGHSVGFDAKDLILNGSDLQVDGSFSIVPSPIFNITKLDVESAYMNLDKLMKVSDRAMKYVPQSPKQASAKPSQPADIPVKMDGRINFQRIVTGNINVKNTTAKIGLDKNDFTVENLRTNVFDGSVRGKIGMNLLTSLLNIQLKGQNVDVEKALLDGAGMKGMLTGTAAFDTDISLKGATYEEQMKSLKGNVNFNVKDGQFGPFGKLENLIIAENIRESQLFQTALGGVISGLTTIDTTHFSELEGSLSFEEGVCHIKPITSLGNILSLHIFGDFDILRNYADMKVRARMASLISNLLGPLGAINPANLLSNAASLNVVTAKAFSIFCEMVPESEMDIIPSFANSYVDNAATKFQLVVRGDAAKPLTLIKSFKWLATESEYQSAVDYVNSIPEPIEGSEATNIEELIQEVEAEKKTLKYKVKHLFEGESD